MPLPLVPRGYLVLSTLLVALSEPQSAIAVDTSSFSNGGTLLAQATPGLPTTPGSLTRFDNQAPLINPSSTILPTDVLPLPAVQNRLTFAENMQLRILQKLPSRFYFSSSVETSFRYETNPFQFPKKRDFNRQLPPPPIQALIGPQNQQAIRNVLKLVNSEDNVYRILPNVTAGFTITPHTRVFGNYFMIRDSLFKNIRLNTVIHSYAWGIQQDIPLGSRGNLQAEFQARELNQMHQHSVFDFLPALTASYVATPRTVLFANALLQLRGRKYFQAPTRELDPFYTVGGLYQKNGWSFSVSSTFVQNFRSQFRNRATIPVNNYAMISDFEIARRVSRQLPGLQAFVRAEPIWNMEAHNRPGLSGMDFRLFYGLRMSVTKPSLTAGLQQLKQQIEEQETEPPKPSPEQNKPSAYLEPYQIVASAPQPIHGSLDLTSYTEAASATLPDEPKILTIMDRRDQQPIADVLPVLREMKPMTVRTTRTVSFQPDQAEQLGKNAIASNDAPAESLADTKFFISQPLQNEPSSSATAENPTVFLRL